MKNTKIKIAIYFLVIFLIISYSPNTFNKTYDVAKASKTQSVEKITIDPYTYSQPKFSPDGLQIIYVSDESSNGFNQIWMMDIDGTNHIQLTFASSNHSFPTFNNDGSKIAFCKEKEYNNVTFEVVDKYIDENGTESVEYYNFTEKNMSFSEIWMMDEDGTNQTLLLGEEKVSYINPVFDENNNLFYIASDYYKIPTYPNDTFRSDNIWKINSNLFISDRTLFFGGHIYSFDIYREKILYHYYSLYSGMIPPHEFILFDIESNTSSDILSLYSSIQYPTFSPDGEQILYTNKSELWVMDIDGSNHTLLLDTEDEISYPSFSPDGKKIVYVEDGDIWIYYLEDERDFSYYILIPVIGALIAAPTVYLLYRKVKGK